MSWSVCEGQKTTSQVFCAFYLFAAGFIVLNEYSRLTHPQNSGEFFSLWSHPRSHRSSEITDPCLSCLALHGSKFKFSHLCSKHFID